MVTDKRILNAINGVKDKTLRDILLKGGDITPKLFKDRRQHIHPHGGWICRFTARRDISLFQVLTELLKYDKIN